MQLVILLFWIGVSLINTSIIIFLEANKIIDDGFTEIDGKKVGVDIYLAGDKKVT